MRRCVVRSTLAERRRKAQRLRLKLLVPVRSLAWGEVLRRRAEFRQSAYWIAYLTQLLGVRCGLGDHGIVELAGTVMHYVSFTTIAHGIRLEAPFSDMEAADVARAGAMNTSCRAGVRLPVLSVEARMNDWCASQNGLAGVRVDATANPG